MRIPLRFLLTIAWALAAGWGMASEPSAALKVPRQLMAERGEWDTAAKWLDDHLRKNPAAPEAPEAWALLGHCRDRLKDDRGAADAYANAAGNENAAPDIRQDALLGAADAHFRLSEFDRAALYYARILEEFPGGPKAADALFWRGEAEYRLAGAVREKGQDADEIYRRAFVDFQAFVRQNPDAKNLPAALAGAAFAAFDSGDYEAALPFFRRLAESFPDDRRAPEAAFYAGESLFLQQNYDAARRAYSLAFERFPDAPEAADARAGVAWVDYRQKRPAEAADGFEAAARMAGPGRRAAGFLYDAGCAWKDAGDAEKAAAAWEAAIAAGDTPFLAPAQFRLGALRLDEARAAKEDDLRRDTLAEAVTLLRKATEREGDLGAEAAEAFLSLGEALAMNRDADAAATAFRKVTESWPRSDAAPWAWYQLAQAYRELSRQAEEKKDAAKRSEHLRAAADALERALADPPAKLRLPATWSLADFRMDLGETEAARERYRWLADEGVPWAERFRDAAGAADPALAAQARNFALNAWLHLAESFFRERDWARASSGYQQIVRQYPDTDHATTAFLRLGEIAETGGDIAAAAEQYRQALLTGLKTGKDKTGAVRNAELRYAAALLALAQTATDPARKTQLLAEAERHAAVAVADPPAGGAARAAFYLAEAQAARGQPDKAAENYARALTLEPKGDVADAAIYGHAWSAKDLGDAALALARFRTLVDEFPESPRRSDAILAIAALDREAGRPEDALAMADRFLKEYGVLPSASRASLERGMALAALGKHAEAADVFERFVGEHPDHPDAARAMYQWSWALWELARPKVEAARKAEADFAALSSGRSPEPRSEAERAYALAAQRAWEDAAGEARIEEDRVSVVLKRFVETYPADPQADAAWLRLGEIAYDRRAYEEALLNYQAAVKAAETSSSPLEDKARYRLAWSLWRLGETAESESDLADDPERKTALRQEAVYHRLEALEAFAALAERFPKSDLAPEALFRAGEVSRRFGEESASRPDAHENYLAAAFQLYSKSVERAPDSPFAQNARLGAGLAQIHRGRAEEARALFEAFLAKQSDGPQAAEAHWGLGRAALLQGNPAEARKAFDRAIRLDPSGETAAKSRYGLGLVALREGDSAQARLAFLEVDVLHAEYPRWAAAALLEAARAALKDGEKEKARADIELILGRYGDTASAVDARQLQAKMSEE